MTANYSRSGGNAVVTSDQLRVTVGRLVGRHVVKGPMLRLSLNRSTKVCPKMFFNNQYRGPAQDYARRINGSLGRWVKPSIRRLLLVHRLSAFGIRQSALITHSPHQKDPDLPRIQTQPPWRRSDSFNPDSSGLNTFRRRRSKHVDGELNVY